MLTQHTCCTLVSNEASYIHLVLILNHVLLQIKRLHRLGGRSSQTGVKHQLKFLVSICTEALQLLWQKGDTIIWKSSAGICGGK